jgi:hypothetical protein
MRKERKRDGREKLNIGLPIQIHSLKLELRDSIGSALPWNMLQKKN